MLIIHTSSFFLVEAVMPKAIPVSIATTTSTSPILVAALPSICRSFTTSARIKKMMLQASSAFCALESSNFIKLMPRRKRLRVLLGRALWNA